MCSTKSSNAAEPGCARPGRAPLKRLKTCGDAAIEGDLDDRRRKVRRLLAGFAVRLARGAGERIALAERVEHLTAHAPRRVRREWRTGIVAIAVRRLHQPVQVE